MSILTMAWAYLYFVLYFWNLGRVSRAPAQPFAAEPPCSGKLVACWCPYRACQAAAAIWEGILPCMVAVVKLGSVEH